jgi:hypothetical protein
MIDRNFDPFTVKLPFDYSRWKSKVLQSKKLVHSHALSDKASPVIAL